MNALFVVIAVLAAPVVLYRLAQLTRQVDSLARRIAELERQLTRQRQQTPEALAKTPQPEPSGHQLRPATPTLAAPSSVSVPPSPAAAPPVLAPPAAAPPLLAPFRDRSAATAGLRTIEGGELATALSPAAPQDQASGISLPKAERPGFGINWEQFMGVKLFAWIGGFALFLGIAFFIKYSFERNLIPPEVRAAIGFLAGLGLLAGGVFMKRRELAVTAHTLCATGVVVLYSVTFACRSVYHFPLFGPWLTFALMAAITAAAFTLAVQLDALVVAILGLVGGFLTPVLLSTGQDNPAALFSYVALLDLGLVAVALRRKWHFLVALSAAGTVLMQIGWCASYFTPEKVFAGMTIFAGFDLLYLLAFAAGEKLKQPNPWLSGSAASLPFATLLFTGYLLGFSSLGERPGVVFSIVLAADLCLLGLALLRSSMEWAHVAAGTAVFLLLAAWTGQHVTAGMLNWALGLYLAFAILHSLFPVLLAQQRPGTVHLRWGCCFAPMALILILIPLVKEASAPMVIWPAVLLVDIVAIALAALTASVTAILAALLLTTMATGLWILKLPRDLDPPGSAFVIIAGFALFFFLAGGWASRRMLANAGRPAGGRGSIEPGLAGLAAEPVSSEIIAAQAPALSAILPFVLLIMLSARLPLFNPAPLFGLAMLLVVLLLAATLLTRVDALAPLGLMCVFLLQYVWGQEHFRPEAALGPLLWHLSFLGVFLAFPFAFRNVLSERLLPWCAAALAGPLHFFLIYHVVSAAYPNEYMGLLPAAFAVPLFVAVAWIRRSFPPNAPLRLDLLAWFGGAALLFVTLIFPIQFERQWITLGWALEGVALIWLFRRVPHPGLRATGVVLLMIAFVRLALNPAVLEYHRNAGTRVFNWYLYAYGVVTICLMTGARLLAPPRHLVWNRRVQPLLYTLGTVLAFLLVNIEIADYFAEGTSLTFQFSGNFARDMSYSISWGLFALVVLMAGIWKRLPAPRYAAIGLLCVTLVKLFTHDLSQLGQLYRIGAFIVVALILMFASFLYQRFVSFDAKADEAR